MKILPAAAAAVFLVAWSVCLMAGMSGAEGAFTQAWQFAILAAIFALWYRIESRRA